MKKIYLLFLLAFLPLLANADAVEIDGIYYNLNAEDQTAEVTVKPGNTSFGSNYSGVIEIPATVTYNEVLYSVTSIGVIAFQNCSVTSVTIPNSVTSIGPNAFDQSYKLTSVTIGSGVTSIGEYAFNACIGLTSILIPKSVITIGERAFYRCTAMTSIVVESGNPNYDSRNNCNALIETATNSLIEGCNNTVIPDGIVTICEGAFVQCEGLTSMIIPNSVTTIGNRAFEGCYNMTSLTLGNGLETIGDNAFIYCNSLNSITIPASVSSIGGSILGRCPGLEKIQVENGNAKYDSRNNCNAIIETASNTLLMGCNHTVIPNSITSIGPGAFGGCTGLTSVTIASGVTSIGEGAFGGCSGLTSIVVEDGNTVYDSRNNCNALIETATGLLVAGCNNSVIPDGVKTIGKSAFSGCKGLTSIMIPNSVTTIGVAAFSGSGLTSVTIPNSVTSIGENVFQGCSDLATVTIGNRISSIGRYAFQECYNLTSVTIPNSVTYIGVLAFNGCNLSSISLGSGITNIDMLAFLNVPLKDVYCSAKEVPEVSSQAFGFSSSINATLHVPASSVDAYKAATPWSGFKEVVAIESKKTINVETAGTLSTLIPETEKYLIEDLSLTGNLNGDDLALIRDMAGNNINGHLTDGRLATLDLSGACIVDGGTYVQFTEEKYYVDADNYVIVKDTKPYISQAYVFRGFLFAGCGALETITLPNTLNSISASSTFSDCKKLKTIYIPASVGYMDSGFTNCPSLTSVIIDPNNAKYESPNNNVIIDKETHALITGCKDAVIPTDKGITSISKYAFLGRIGETTMEIPEGITSIGDYAFAQTDLTSVVLPSTLVTIDNRAFQGCNKLTGIVLPASVETIGNQAFANIELQTVTVKNPTPIAIQESTFSNRANADLIVPVGCVAAYQAADYWKDFKTISANTTAQEFTDDQGVKYTLTANGNAYTVSGHTDACTGDIIIPATVNGHSVTSIGEYSFQNCSALTSVTIGNGVTTISNGAFNHCNGLTSVTIPNSVTSIGGVAFDGCSGLTSITIPNSVITIGFQAFYECENLTTVTIGSGITEIGELAFGELRLLKDVYCYATEVPSVPTSAMPWAFGESNLGATLHVPYGTKDAYLNADGWKDFKNIVEMGESVAIKIGSKGKATFTGKKSLDFSYSDKVKAYVATGIDKESGTIWLTRVKDVPAGVPVLIKGEANKTYNVPVKETKDSYYKNMFVGNTSGESITIYETSDDGTMTNYYMSGGQFVSVKGNAKIGDGKCYLQLPTTLPASAPGADQPVTIAKTGKSSYAAPVDLDFTNVDGLKAFTATGYDRSSKTIWLTRVMKAQKGEGLLLKGDANQTYNIPSAGVQSGYGNMFVGNTSGESITIYETNDDGSLMNFYLSKGQFVSVNKSATIANNKCYLQLPTEMVSAGASTRGAEANYIFEEPEVISMPIVIKGLTDADGTTGIDEIIRHEPQADDAFYNLQGQRVDNPGKGLYIRNGKKVVVKNY